MQEFLNDFRQRIKLFQIFGKTTTAFVKDLENKKNILQEIRQLHLKPIIQYQFPEFHKSFKNGLRPFRKVSSIIDIHTYELGKFLGFISLIVHTITKSIL